MTDTLLKDKNNEIYENFETDDKEEELKKKKSKSKLAKLLIIVIIFIFIFGCFIYYKYFHRFSNSLNLTLLEEYNELGKKDENLQLFFSIEFGLERRRRKFMNGEFTFQLNKDDIDKNKLLKAINLVVENQAIFH